MFSKQKRLDFHTTKSYFYLMQTRKDIRSLTIKELESFCIERNEKPFRARQVYEWLWKKSARGFSEMTNLPKSFRELLNDTFDLLPLKINTSQTSADGTIKYGFLTYDNHLVEGVLIPTDRRLTACISSQIGCSLNCLFCATGQLKYYRNLNAGEIYDQVYLINTEVKKKNGKKLSNIVMMGMGEPLLNYDNVTSAIEKISSHSGLGFAPKRITLSTVGITKMIQKLGDDNVPCNLAISLHTASNEKRNQFMAINKSNPLDELAESIKYFYSKTRTRITYEYLLLADFNDNLSDARDLADLCTITPCKINLIEYNEVPGSPFEKSDPRKTQKFKEFLESKNLVVNIRKSRGADIEAACGQLAGRTGRTVRAGNWKAGRLGDEEINKREDGVKK